MARRLLLLITIFLFLSLSCSTQNETINPKINILWNPSKLEMTLGLGDYKDVNAAFSCSEDASNVDVIVAPELKSVVSVTPDHLDFMAKGATNNIRISFSIPGGFKSGYYKGTIRIKIGNSVLTDLMSVELNVVEAAKIIGAAGGTIKTLDDYISLEVPPGALSSDELITITYHDEGLNLGQLGTLVRLEPEGLIL